MGQEFLLWLYKSMLRGDGEAVGWPGQFKGQLSGRLVADLNQLSVGRSVYTKNKQTTGFYKVKEKAG